MLVEKQKTENIMFVWVIYLVLLVVIVVVTPVSTQSEQHYEDGHGYLEGAVAKIRAAAILNRADGAGGILPDELQDVIHVLNERINTCDPRKIFQEPRNCQCLTLDLLYRNLNISETTVLNGTKLADLAVYVVYYALNPSAVCLEDAKTLCNDSSCALQFIQDAFLREDLDQANITHAARLQRLLSEIKKIYTPNNKSKCFDVTDIVSDIGLDSINDIDFHAQVLNEISVALLLRIIEGECILAHKGDEATVYFFKKYGDHGNLRISAVGFDKLLWDLKFYKSKNGKNVKPCFVEDNVHNATDNQSMPHDHVHDEHDRGPLDDHIHHDHDHHNKNVDEQRKLSEHGNHDHEHEHVHIHNESEVTPGTNEATPGTSGTSGTSGTTSGTSGATPGTNEATPGTTDVVNITNVILMTNLSEETTFQVTNGTTPITAEMSNPTTLPTIDVRNGTELENGSSKAPARALRSLDQESSGDTHDHGEHHDHEHEHSHAEEISRKEECAIASLLISEADADGSKDLDTEEFIQLCPSLLRQMAEWNSNAIKANATTKSLNNYEVYGYGTLSIFIISLCSLFGILLVPCLSTRVYEFFMMGFIALGFGSMLGDAILHLTPQFLGLHSHSEENDHGGAAHEHEEIPAYFYTCLTVVGAIYVFFVFEGCAHILGKRMRKRVGPTETTSLNGNGHGHSHNNAKILKILKRESLKRSPVKTISRETLAPESRVESVTSLEMQPETNFLDSPKVCCGLKSVAMMIIIGDTLHNVADGLAIGAAFAVSTRGGISTSIAIFCHEFPHELGDFAILLSTGLSKRSVLGWNFVSSLSSFIGLYAGIAIGMNPSSSQWILAVTAGMFLYISLGDMLPEMKNCTTSSPWLMFFAQNLGVVAGIAAMALIAIYEDQIKI